MYIGAYYPPKEECRIWWTYVCPNSPGFKYILIFELEGLLGMLYFASNFLCSFVLCRFPEFDCTHDLLDSVIKFEFESHMNHLQTTFCVLEFQKGLHLAAEWSKHRLVCKFLVWCGVNDTMAIYFDCYCHCLFWTLALNAALSVGDITVSLDLWHSEMMRLTIMVYSGTNWMNLFNLFYLLCTEWRTSACDNLVSTTSTTWCWQDDGWCGRNCCFTYHRLFTYM